MIEETRHWVHKRKWNLSLVVRVICHGTGTNVDELESKFLSFIFLNPPKYF